jgi:hypothetical protein
MLLASVVRLIKEVSKDEIKLSFGSLFGPTRFLSSRHFLAARRGDYSLGHRCLTTCPLFFPPCFLRQGNLPA